MKKINKKQSGSKQTTNALKVLKDKRYSKKSKALAGSVLAQTRYTTKRGK